MKILVTGVGFLGGHLVELLLTHSHHVTVLDCFWTGTPANLERLRSIFPSQLIVIEHDVSVPFPLAALNDVERIYHLACPASPKRFPENPIKILETCYLGTMNALMLAKATGARLLLASTSEVYGDPIICPQPESYWGNVNSFGPRSCYDEGKRVAEALCYAYRLQQKVDTRIVRIFNAYGPGLLPQDGRVVSNFFDAALHGREIVIQGDGKASRCFQYATDCVRGIELLMESQCLSPVNIGAETETTIGHLAQTIAALVWQRTGKETKIVYGDRPEDDPFRRVPDCERARKELGWEPEIQLHAGLEKTLEWHLSLRDIEVM